MVGDPIGDFIIRLKNAGAVRKEYVSVPYSRFRHAVADKLRERGFVGDVVKRGKKARKTLGIEMRYRGGICVIAGVKRVSKPGRRVYRGVSHLYPVRAGKGALLLSTPKGILTSEEARKAHVGGEALFEIW